MSIQLGSGLDRSSYQSLGGYVTAVASFSTQHKPNTRQSGLCGLCSAEFVSVPGTRAGAAALYSTVRPRAYKSAISRMMKYITTTDIVLLMLVTLLGLVHTEASHFVNVTVDDSGLDPLTNTSILYTGPWSRGQDCPFCFSQPQDKAEIYDASWHDTTYNGGGQSGFANFSFTGGSFTLCIAVI